MSWICLNFFRPTRPLFLRSKHVLGLTNDLLIDENYMQAWVWQKGPNKLTKCSCHMHAMLAYFLS